MKKKQNEPSEDKKSEDLSYINNSEINSLNALISHTAHGDVNEENRIREEIASKFSIENIEKLPRTAFEAALGFLIDYKKPTLH